MGTCYEQLSAAERKTIGRLHAAGQSGRAIARTLVRALSGAGQWFGIPPRGQQGKFRHSPREAVENSDI